MSTERLQPLRDQSRVFAALMLRDIRTRFFGHGLGYLIAIFWPVAHIVIVMVAFSVGNRVAPYGSSVMLFATTGLVPFMTWSYLSRFTMMALIMNRPLVVFPVVKVLDVLLARALLESIAACCSVIVVMVLLASFGIDPWPRDVVQASFALGASLLLGIGFGILNGLIALAVPTWVTGYSLIIVLFYIFSGIIFVTDRLPPMAQYWLSFNPILHGVEWMRSAYYDGYGSHVLDKGYVLGWAIGTILAGLLIERLLRRRLLQN